MATEPVSKPPSLPPYPEMIMGAIDALKEKEGSNMSSIGRHIEATYGDLPAGHMNSLTEHLNKLKEEGEIVLVKNNYMRRLPEMRNKRKLTAKMRKLIPLKEDLSPEIFGHTPEGLIYEIFSRLPVDVATRCKLVSKTWNSNISNPDFGKYHFEISSTRRANLDDNTLVVHSYDYEDEGNTNVISIVDFNSRSRVPRFEFSYVESDFPSKPRLFIVGCDVGIICLYSSLADTSKIYMWNPLIGHYKSIRSFNIPADDSVRRRVVLGFGYDPVGKDFKVVRVVPPSFSVEVYSANRDAWQNIEPKPSEIPIDPNIDSNFDVSLNGFLFTAGTYGMITFDLNTHVFNCIKFPPPTFDPNVVLFNTFKNSTRITEFHHSIAAIICERTDFIVKVELWALNDESCLRGGGVEASWNKMFNFDSNWDLQSVYGHFNTGDFLLLVADLWYLYNPNNVADSCDFGNENARMFADSFYYWQIFRYRKCLLPIA